MEELPVEILYNIFDFLFTEDVIKFSILSKRLNNVAKTYSNTNNSLFYIHSINDFLTCLKIEEIVIAFGSINSPIFSDLIKD